MAWAYILQGKFFYVGSTVDLEKRLLQHKRGHTHTTKRIGDWALVWEKEFAELKLARSTERKIKNWKSKKMIQLLIDGKIDV